MCSLKKYKTGYTGVESAEGEKSTHNLQSGNTTYVEIQTQKDATGNEIIKQIILNPGTSPKKMPLKEGSIIFCTYCKSYLKVITVFVHKFINNRAVFIRNK